MIRNRRYKKMMVLMEEGEYFSEERVRERDPILYYLYVGRFIRNGDVRGPSANTIVMSEFLEKC